MERTIKFRAWNNDTNKMFDWIDIQSWVCAIEWDDMFANANIDLEQFTGLHDKNGKEIFEGDIVNFARKKAFCQTKKCEEGIEFGTSKYCPKCGTKITQKDFVKKAEIIFREGSYCLHQKHGDYGISNWATYIAANYIEWIEIIGHIHEHIIEDFYENNNNKTS